MEVISLSLILSIVAIAVSLVSFYLNYRRSRKTEQLKLCLDISSRLDDADNKVFEIIDKLNSNTTDQELIKGWKLNHRYAYLSFLNHWEFFSFLVNSGEIHERKILDYFKGLFKRDVKQIFEAYPDFRAKDAYAEVKKLLKEWDPNYYSSHFESK